ncbi:4-galactosyl-N-acetylglucosaminide 3-alpha-L-fucosyltransferase 9-like [Osmerus eperlanus]|uniref:4-galactosyl-N-acetylglucosaminide 3-alpha-L-fucosyltransferase 9-like n=1 Tax=Osmerus eperlanus TaxID=29151 RepID=UPI002E157F12
MPVTRNVKIIAAIYTVVAFYIYFRNISLCENDVDVDHAAQSTDVKKPLVLLWFWPGGQGDVRFNLKDCGTFFNIDGCVLTDNRSLFDKSDAVIFYHKEINWDLSNMPRSPRPRFQKWIWFNLEPPSHTQKIPGLEKLFNLTMSYRRHADIIVRYDLLGKKTNQDSDFVLPRKDKMVCLIVSNKGAYDRKPYYEELSKHIKLHLFGEFSWSRVKHENYYSTIASCKFYLAFENSVHKDYITENMNSPLAVGTVPVVSGTSRQNYEEFFPADSFIHVNDYPNAKALAEFLIQLDKNDEMYMQYFNWRKYLTVPPQLLTDEKEFTLPVCTACDHISRDNGYSVVQDLYKWYFV